MARLAAEAARPLRSRIGRPDRAQLEQQGADVGIGQGEHVAFEHRVAETAGDHRVADLLDRRERGQWRLFFTRGEVRLAQLDQRVGAEGREQQQSARPQHATQFRQRRRQVRDPLQAKAGKNQVDARVGQRQRRRVGAHALDRSPEPRVLGYLAQHRQRQVERDHLAARPALLHRAARAARAAADIEDARRLAVFEHLELVEQARFNLALQHRDVRVTGGRATEAALEARGVEPARVQRRAHAGRPSANASIASQTSSAWVRNGACPPCSMRSKCD